MNAEDLKGWIAMTITFNGWMIIASWVLILAVLVGLMIVEEREDKRRKTCAEKERAWQHKRIEDAHKHQKRQMWINYEDWRKAK